MKVLVWVAESLVVIPIVALIHLFAVLSLLLLLMFSSLLVSMHIMIDCAIIGCCNYYSQATLKRRGYSLSAQQIRREATPMTCQFSKPRHLRLSATSKLRILTLDLPWLRSKIIPSRHTVLRLICLTGRIWISHLMQQQLRLSLQVFRREVVLIFQRAN